MDLNDAYQMLTALEQPAALADGAYGPLNDEQQNYAQMIYEGSVKARQWVEEWIKLERQPLNADAIAVHAHKINSGLTMMLGYASLMLTGVGGTVGGDVEAALTAIVSTGEQVHRALQQDFDDRLRQIAED